MAAASDHSVSTGGALRSITLFLTSHQEDFGHERRLLKKEVFPELQAWCEDREISLLVRDVRWGGYHSKQALDEVISCSQNLFYKSQMPFFVNITGDGVGRVPCRGQAPDDMVDEYHNLLHFSPEEAYFYYSSHRDDNPNVLMLLRQDEFFDYLGEKERKRFIPKEDLSRDSLCVGLHLLHSVFKKDRVLSYAYGAADWNAEKHQVEVEIEDEGRLVEKIVMVLKSRILSHLNLSPDCGEVNEFEMMRREHHSFLMARSLKVRGREEIIEQIKVYCMEDSREVPLLLLGGAGSGKSSIMAQAAHHIRDLVHRGLFHGSDKCYIFYHFVGALPGSTSLVCMLQRILKELDVCFESELTRDVNAAAQLCCNVLSNPTSKPVILFIDAINQFNEEPAAQIMSWLPWKLAPNVRCVISLINDTQQHKMLMKREPLPKELHLTPLDIASRKQIINELLETHGYDTYLNEAQMQALLSKKASENPLWLWVACEEICRVDTPDSLSQKIRSLPDGLLDLLEEVLSRLESEGGGSLFVAAVCLLEVSASGLLEEEMRQLLGKSSDLVPPSPYEEKEEKESLEKEDQSEKSASLSSEEWSVVSKGLQPFLRPYGNGKDGRLDFYHRALSKAVRRKFLKTGHENESCEESQELYLFWHQKLANFFEKCKNLDRKTEEYMYHLSKIDGQSRMVTCLTDWGILQRLYNPEHSSQLLTYWRQAGGTGVMIDSYKEVLSDLESQTPRDEQELALHYEQVARIFLQAGSYSESLELTTVAIKWEEKELGNRPDRMVELYSLMSEIYDEKLKLNDFVSESQIPDLRKTINYGRKSISLREKFTENASNLPADKQSYHKLKMAMSLMKLAFSLESWEACGGDSDLLGEEALEEGNKHIDAAIEIFKQLQDRGHYAEALMTKGVLAKRGSNQQLEHYNKAMDICRQVYGELSLLTSRLYINIGIVHEDNNDFVCAFGFFKKWAHVSELVLGPEHPKTLRAKGVLREPRYSLVEERLKQLEDQQREAGNEEFHRAISIAEINSEVKQLTNREVNPVLSLGISGEELAALNETAGESLQVPEELQQAINDLLQRALGELEMRENTEPSALLDQVEEQISQSSQNLRATLNILENNQQNLDSNILSENMINLALNDVHLEDDDDNDDINDVTDD